MLCPADYSNLIIYQQSMSTAFKKKAYITHWSDSWDTEDRLPIYEGGL